MINRTTSWPEVAPLSSITAESSVSAFLFSWVTRFGVQSVLRSNCGTQFSSFVWTGVCHFLGISPSITTSFLPQSKSIVKHFHRSLKTALRACLVGSDWFLHLPLVLLGLWSVSKEDTWLCLRGCLWFSPPYHSW